MEKLKQLCTTNDSNPLFIALSGLFGHKCYVTVVLKEYMTKISDELCETQQNLLKQEEAIIILHGMIEDQFEEQADYLRQIEELQMLLTARDEECVFLNKELKMALRELEEHKHQACVNLSKLESKLKVQSDSISQLMETVNEMKRDNAKLRRELANTLKEKSALQKRLVNLQLYRFKATDKWMDDKDTNNCVYCNVQFKFFVRKHHCRLCGKICCHTCSDYWLPTTAKSFRGTSRVCKYCFEDRMAVLDTAIKNDVEDVAEVESVKFKNESSMPRNIVGTEKTPKSPSNAMRNRLNSPLDVAVSKDDSEVMSLPLSESCSELPKMSFTSTENRQSQVIASSPIDWISVGSTSSLSDVSTVTKYKTTEPYLRHQSPTSDSYKRALFSLHDKSIKDFDIITDEEISRSLSAYSPYSPLQNEVEKNSDSETSLKIGCARTIKDIEENKNNGSNGTVWIIPGGEYGIPILVENVERKIKILWEFTSDPQCLGFSVAYKKSGSHSSIKPIMCATQVRSHMHCISGHVLVKDPGLYFLFFHNNFSKFTVNKVNYLLTVRRYGIDDED